VKKEFLSEKLGEQKFAGEKCGPERAGNLPWGLDSKRNEKKSAIISQKSKSTDSKTMPPESNA